MGTAKLLSAVAALAIAGTAAVSTSAKADSGFGSFVVPAGYYDRDAGPPQCWAWSHRRHHWVWICGSQPQYQQPVYPLYPYDPFYQPGPSFGFFFGGGGFGGGDDHYRHHR